MDYSTLYKDYNKQRSRYSYYGLINSKNEYAQVRITNTHLPEIRDMVATKIRTMRNSKCKLRKLSYDEFYQQPVTWDWRCVMQQHMREM